VALPSAGSAASPAGHAGRQSSGAELGVFVVPPRRPRADLRCPTPAAGLYLLQVEAVDLPRAPEPPDSTDVLPVQADGQGGRQLCGSRGRGVLEVSVVLGDPSLPAGVVRVGSAARVLTGCLGSGALPAGAGSSWR